MGICKPPDTTPAYMHNAWADCLRWASTNSDIVKRFQADTGISADAPDKNEDKHDYFVGKKFVDWFNENVWGDVNEVPEED